MLKSTRRYDSLRSSLICFIGIDGSGKTTLAKLLVEEMRKRGIKCIYVYGRYKPILSKPMVLLGKFLFLRGKDIRKYKEYSKTKREVVKKHTLLTSIYQNVLLFDYTIQLLTKIFLPRIFGITVVCDRYIYDTVVNDIPRSDNSFNAIKKLVEKCFKIAPKPDLVFLIDIPEDLAYKRKNDTPSIDYLKERRKIYIQLGKDYNMIILNGTKSLEELKAEIERRVFG